MKKNDKILSWCIAVSLTLHCVGLTGIGYLYKKIEQANIQVIDEGIIMFEVGWAPSATKPEVLEEEIIDEPEKIEQVIEKTVEKMPDPIEKNEEPTNVIDEVVEKPLETLETVEIEKEEPQPVLEEVPEKQQISEPSENMKEGESGEAPVTAGAGEKEYLALVREKIQRAKSYPRIARMHRMQGVVAVRFAINVEGQLVTPLVLRCSGSAFLDVAAIRILKKASPFQPPPESLADKNIDVEIDFRLK
ncbi:MAG: energy transducer TonB [Candidatus Theseobacter exili]|nr:energy transducer TonB [Candidatus Theseobacter exili]